VPPRADHAPMRGFATLALVAFLGAGCLGDGKSRSAARGGPRLLFVAEPDGYVFTVEAGGRGLRQLTRGNDWGARRGVWSPDGSRIAVVTNKVPEGRNAAVLVMSADGRSQRRLAFIPSEESQLRWGSAKAIEVRAYTAFRRIEISTVDSEHGGPRRLVRVIHAPPAVLSPDGSRLAFERKNGHGDTQIFVGRPDRSRAVNVSRSRSRGPSRLVESGETWSPDGTRLAFTLDRGLGNDTREIRVMSADGSNERRLAVAPHWRGGPVWSSDGRSLAYVADADDDGLDELYVAGLDGGRPRRLAEREYIQDIAWQPGAAAPAPPAAPPSANKIRLVRTYSSKLATGHARLTDVRLLARFASLEDRPSLADLSPDGSLLALFWRGSLSLLDLRTNELRFVAPARPSGREPQALFSPDGKRLLYRSWARLLSLELATGRRAQVATSGWGEFAWLTEGRVAFSDLGRLKIVRPGRRPHSVLGVPRVARWAISSDGRGLLYDRRCETFLLDRTSRRPQRLSGHMFVLPRSWAPDGAHFVLQWAEECTPKTDSVWAYHTFDILYNRSGEENAGVGGHGATWSRDSKALFVYSQPTGTAVGGLEALIAVDPRLRRQSTLLREGNADGATFVGPGGWVVFTRYDVPERVSYNETSGGLYVARLVGR
jgi:WD40 repeat protein